jgi:hypothetical protein
MKVYNKIVQKNFEMTNLFTPKSTQVRISPAPPLKDVTIVETPVESRVIQEYVPIKQMDIMLSQKNALNTVGNETDQVIYGQGQLVLPLDPVDNYIKFTVYQANPVKQTSQTRVDLNNNSNFKLNFGKTAQFSFSALTDITLTSPSKGEVSFRIPKEQALLILATSDTQFFLTLVSKIDGTETLFYTGTWVSSMNYSSVLSSKSNSEAALQSEKKIASLREQVSKLTIEKENITKDRLDSIAIKTSTQRETPKSINAAAATKPPASQQTASA